MNTERNGAGAMLLRRFFFYRFLNFTCKYTGFTVK